MDGKQLGIFFTAFITILVGVVVLQSLITQNYYVQNTETQKTLFTAINGTCVKVTTNDCIDSITSVTNGSGTIATGNYTTCSSTSNGYVDGVLFVTASTKSGSLNVTYAKSTGCSYVTDGTSKTLVTITLLMFILAIVIVGIYFMRKSGILDWF